MRRSNKNKELLFVLTPNLGIVDNLIPLLDKIKKKNSDLKVYALILDKKTTFNYNKSLIILLMNNYLDEIIVTFDEKNFYRYKNIQDFYIKLNFYKKFKKIHNLFEKIYRKTKFLNFNLFLDIFINSSKDKIINFKKKFYNLNNILIDIGEINKLINVFKFVPNANFLSFPNGIALAQLSNKDEDKVIINMNTENLKKIYVFIFNTKEKYYYKKKFGISDEKILHIPILRHKQSWVNSIIKFEKTDIPLSFNNYIIIASKPGTNRAFPRNNKIKMIKIIKKLFVDNMKMKLIIKLHPKEKDDGLYSHLLGKEFYKKNWFISSNHIFTIAQRAKLCISFGGSLPVDLINLNIPSIEFRDLNNIREFDNEDALRDKNNNPISYLAYQKLFFSATDYENLSNIGKNIFKNYNTIIEENKKNYKKIFLNPENEPNFILRFFL